MSASANPDIVTKNLVFCLDKADTKVDYYDDPVERAQGIAAASSSNATENNFLNGSVSDFMNNYSQITIMAWITKNRYHTGYAQHPINKWGPTGSSTNGASIVLYHFGDYNSNGDDVKFSWYVGLGGNTWRGSNRVTLEVGETAFLCYKYTANTGMQVWKNASKIGGRTSTGQGNGGTTSDKNLTMYSSDYYTTHTEQVLMYDRDLSDAEILQNFNATKSRFNL